MSQVRFISDLHLGHKSICEFSGPQRGGVSTVEDHDQWIVNQWNSVVQKNDLVWILGDVCFDADKLSLLKKMKGNKHLILGNHDKFSISLYSQYFNKIHGFLKYKGFWISHAPINSAELRGKLNIHGHVHNNSVDDFRYINVCVEAVQGKPIAFSEILEISALRREQYEKSK